MAQLAQMNRAEAFPLNFGPQFPTAKLPFSRSPSQRAHQVTERVNPDFLLKGFTLQTSTRESTKASLLQYAGNSLKNLKAGTTKTRKAYADALEVAKQALQNLQQEEDFIEQATIAYTYFQVTLSDGALERGADVLCLNRRSKDLQGGEVRLVYRSKWPGSVGGLPQAQAQDPGLSPCSSLSPSPASTEVGDLPDLPLYFGTSKEVSDSVEYYAHPVQLSL
ncbi:hypothetical protein FIBSPDRAFT_900421 [Athelia psychrophila]|uniref:Uncharacterized protein n=1 Tax=Athelia psychrophila TaxID=1759441 RepID=A0A165YI18_9AGAM|nr:hypothetical protein FIBSPDRAFT_900421 [Fibularhizoctonia sp. CBS 109695]